MGDVQTYKYHVCHRMGQHRCWQCGKEAKVLGEWIAQYICHDCLHDPENYRPCEGPLCSGDPYHKECDCG